MEKSKLEEWLTEFNGQIDSAFRFSFPVRDRELQKEAIGALNAYHAIIDSERLRLRTEKDSDSANLFLGMCRYALSVVQILQMWQAIRSDDANRAWDLLVGAQDHARAAMRAHRHCAAHMAEYSRYLSMLERLLFPPQQFISSSFVVRASDCSLCNAPFHKCAHISGFPYNGDFCVEIIRDISDVDHIAFVDCPDDKRCRITAFTENGFDIDSFTLRRTPRDKDKGDRTAEMIVLTRK